MRIDRLRLSNFKPYADCDLALDTGVTVIHGPNGGGKSSLLEACFFALYGASALSGTLEEAITNGEEECEVSLSFTHGGESFELDRRIRLSGDRATTARCTLETLEGTIDGARDVERAVTDLLRMDDEAFVNCAYVRQGEVNKLIHATPAERQDTIDELLQLGTLEEYRERTNEARLGVEDVRSDVRGGLSEIGAQIETKEAKELPTKLNELETELAEVEGEIERFEGNRDRARETREEAIEVLSEHEERREELSELQGEAESLRETIAETEREREALRERIGERRDEREELAEERREALAESSLDADADTDAIAERRSELENEVESVREAIRETSLAKQEAASEASAAEERAEDRAERAAANREEAEALSNAIDEAETTLESRRAAIGELDERASELEAEFADAPIERGEAEAYLTELEDERETLRDERSEIRASLEAARERVSEAERLLSEGKCPECGQPVEGSPHVDSLSADRERVDSLAGDVADFDTEIEALDTEIETAEELCDAEAEIERLREQRSTLSELVEERASSIQADRERVETLRENAAELDDDAETAREEARAARERAEEHRTKLADLDEDREALAERIDRVDRISDLGERVAEIETEIDRLAEGRESKEALNDERRERLAEKREQVAELEAEYDPERIERAEANREEAEEYLERVEAKLSELEAEEAALRDRIGGVRGELDELDALRDRREEIAARLEALDSLYEEVDALQSMYASLRAELRQRNVETLERMLNETFDLVYRNDSYAHIELTGEYELTVYQKDGEALDPEQLSGGERALFNLSLRCAIYRLLAEGIEGTAPMPPLILDEPTTFLDAGHVRQLVELIEAMRTLGVDQIVVVSHDDELIGAADRLVTVEKDPTSNRSSVERETADALTADD